MMNVKKEEEIYQPEYVKSLFNSMSKTYEAMNYITSFGFSIFWRSKLLQKFKNSNSELEVIDLLTGMGETWGSIFNKFPKANLSALDFSTEMLIHASKRNNLKFENKINLLNQDILKNSLPSCHFDYVFCTFGLKTFNEQQVRILARETKRILKPGGSYAFIEISRPDNLFLRMFYSFYLKSIIPLIGRLFLGNPDTYSLLWTYTNKFKNAKIAKAIFEEEGLSSSYLSFFFGCATGFCGTDEQF